MYLQQLQQPAAEPVTEITVLPPVYTREEILAQQSQLRLDETSTTGVIYVGAAPIAAAEEDEVWIVFRFDGVAKQYAQTVIAWTARVGADYGI